MEIDTEPVLSYLRKMYFQSISNNACYIRATEAHEATMADIEILKIREIMRDNPDYFAGVTENIERTVNKAITFVFFHSKSRYYLL